MKKARSTISGTTFFSGSNINKIEADVEYLPTTRSFVTRDFFVMLLWSGIQASRGLSCSLPISISNSSYKSFPVESLADFRLLPLCEGCVRFSSFSPPPFIFFSLFLFFFLCFSFFFFSCSSSHSRPPQKRTA